MMAIRLGTGHEAADAVMLAHDVLTGSAPIDPARRSQARDFLAGLLLHEARLAQRQGRILSLTDLGEGLTREASRIEERCQAMKTSAGSDELPHPLAVASAVRMLGLAPPIRRAVLMTVVHHLLSWSGTGGGRHG